MLPLRFCHFKNRCYIKTARNYVQHQGEKKALKMIPLHSVLLGFFFFVFF